MVYGPVASALVGRLKYGDRPELAAFCAQLMAGAGTDFWSEQPVLLPVPLHQSRRRFRRYNQSVLLAQHLARLTLKGDRVVGEEWLLSDLNERIRDVVVGPDGAVYVLTDNSAGRILKLVPR